MQNIRETAPKLEKILQHLSDPFWMFANLSSDDLKKLNNCFLY